MGFFSTVLGIVGAAVGFVVGGPKGALIGYSIGSSIGSHVEPKPKLPETSAVPSGVMLNQRSSVAPIPVIYGSRRVGGPVVFIDTTGDSRIYLHLVVVLCEGPVAAINDVFLDDVAITDAKFDGLVECYRHLGDESVADPQLIARSSKWTSVHLLKGVAYLYLQLKYDANSLSALPTVTADVDGRLLYDPRSGQTGFSHNPALAIRDYLTNTLYGCGLPASALDEASFIAAANHCDEVVNDPGISQPRYTCNGIVNVDARLVDNIEHLKSCCCGWLVWQAGYYGLLIDQPASPVATITPDQITGSWEIDSNDHTTRTNRIKVTWYNPSAKWQPDLLNLDAPAMRADDQGFLLDKAIELPFTASGPMASRIGWILLKRSRLFLTVHLTCTMEGLPIEVGSVVAITHPTAGWMDKRFMVLKIRLLVNDEVELWAQEYDPGVYQSDVTTNFHHAPSLGLPDPYHVTPPASLEVTESLYVTRSSSAPKAKAIITWISASDLFRISVRIVPGSEWRLIGTTSETAFEWLDVAPGMYEFRVVAVNAIGAASDPTMITTEIFGLSVPPQNPTGLTLSGLGGIALLRWDASPDLDVRIGGGALIRYTPDTTDATWSASISASNRLPGDATSATLPLRTGSYMLRFIDSSGILSPGYATVVATQDTVLAYDGTGTISYHPEWMGEKTGCAVDDGTLKLDGITLVDAWGEIDTIALIDLGDGDGIATNGTFTPAETLDFGAVVRRRLTATVRATIYSANDTLDARLDPIDAWIDIDAEGVAGADARVEASYTMDDPNASPAWSEWRLLEVHEMVARAARFRLHLSSDGFFNISIPEFSIISDTVQP
ncbi:MAG: hypothetical protein HQL86_05360 [Magnetococcales bacterium]|nr:hypothetical protein [Magnetococcales bacterium]